MVYRPSATLGNNKLLMQYCVMFLQKSNNGKAKYVHNTII